MYRLARTALSVTPRASTSVKVFPSARRYVSSLLPPHVVVSFSLFLSFRDRANFLGSFRIDRSPIRFKVMHLYHCTPSRTKRWCFEMLVSLLSLPAFRSQPFLSPISFIPSRSRIRDWYNFWVTMMRLSVRKFAQEVVEPKSREMDENEKMDPAIIKGLFDQGVRSPSSLNFTWPCQRRLIRETTI